MTWIEFPSPFRDLKLVALAREYAVGGNARSKCSQGGRQGWTRWAGFEQVGLLAAANRERNNMQEQRHSGKTKANPQNQMAELSRAGHSTRDEEIVDQYFTSLSLTWFAAAS